MQLLTLLLPRLPADVAATLSDVCMLPVIRTVRDAPKVPFLLEACEYCFRCQC